MQWFLEALRKYAVFHGRARRSEYWYFVLFYVIFSVVATMLDVVTGSYDQASGFGLFNGLLTLGLLIPSLAVTVRRLHDSDHSGWWVLIALVPILGALVLLFFMVLDSTPGTNRHGPNPKGVAGQAATA